MTDDIYDKLKNYRTYLKSEIKNYKEISDGASLQGSVTADAERGAVEKILQKFDEDFPKIKE